MGIPSVLIVVEQFVAAARATARAQGMPEVPMVVVPQDYLVEDRDDVRERVEPVVGQILDLLYVSAESG